MVCCLNNFRWIWKLWQSSTLIHGKKPYHSHFNSCCFYFFLSKRKQKKWYNFQSCCRSYILSSWLTYICNSWIFRGLFLSIKNNSSLLCLLVSATVTHYIIAFSDWLLPFIRQNKHKFKRVVRSDLFWIPGINDSEGFFLHNLLKKKNHSTIFVTRQSLLNGKSASIIPTGVLELKGSMFVCYPRDGNKTTKIRTDDLVVFFFLLAFLSNEEMFWLTFFYTLLNMSYHFVKLQNKNKVKKTRTFFCELSSWHFSFIYKITVPWCDTRVMASNGKWKFPFRSGQFVSSHLGKKEPFYTLWYNFKSSAKKTYLNFSW